MNFFQSQSGSHFLPKISKEVILGLKGELGSLGKSVKRCVWGALAWVAVTRYQRLGVNNRNIFSQSYED